MSKIDEMIKEMCPNGVERVPLWKLTAWDKKFNAVDKSMQARIIKYNYLLAKELDDIVVPNGDIRILYTTEEIAYTVEYKVTGKISEGEVVAIPWGGNPTVKYYKGRFVTGDNRIATSLDTRILDNKYLYYWLSSQIDELALFYRGAGIKHPSMFSVLTMEIPLPPLAIQQEIVSVLDKFTDLISDIDKAIEQRQKQYEYYREKLLTFEEGECEWKKLGEICEVINGRAYKQEELLNTGKYRVLRVGNFFSNDSWYYSDLELEEKYYCEYNDLLYAWSASFGPHIWKEEKVIYHYHIWKLECKAVLERKYMYYWLQSSDMQNQISSDKHGATMAHLTKALMEKLDFPLPPLTTQRSIVATLDKFETLISDLKQMRELRQKQYEYYREKLLVI